MIRAALCLAGFLLTAMPLEALAQDYQATRATNALQDIARAQERQADSLHRLESHRRDQARADDTARRNAERDSRSMRRFDR